MVSLVAPQEWFATTVPETLTLAHTMAVYSLVAAAAART